MKFPYFKNNKNKDSTMPKIEWGTMSPKKNARLRMHPCTLEKAHEEDTETKSMFGSPIRFGDTSTKSVSRLI
jgi:hypothetical protein